MKKKIAISQSNYIPWKGYFDNIKTVDVFVLYDDMQFTKRDWRNRNKIKTRQGVKWLTIPVEVKGKYYQKIKDVKISDKKWNQKHWNILSNNYKNAKGFLEVKDFIEDLYLKADFQYLSEINFHFLKKISDYLGIDVDFKWSSEFRLEKDRNERLVSICKQLNGTDYYAGPAAKAYMDMAVFKEKEIGVHFLSEILTSLIF